MNELMIATAITLSVLPGVILRHMVSSKMLSPSVKITLVKAYLVCFFTATIIIGFVTFCFSSQIGPLFYKLSVIILGLIYFIISCIVIKGMFFHQIFVLCIQCIFTLILHSFAAVILSNVESLIPYHQQFVIQSAIYCILFLILIYPLWRIVRKSFIVQFSYDHSYYWNIVWLIPAFIFISNILVTMDNHWINTWQQLLARLFTGGAIIISWKCINLDFKSLEKMIELHSQNDLLKCQVESIHLQAINIQDNENKIKIIRHDLRHNIRILSQLLTNEEYDAALSILKTLTDELSTPLSINYCANPVINSALTVYSHLAKQHSISTEFMIDLPASIPWESSDIALLLSNSLENSIHASISQPIKCRSIRIITRYDENQLVIEIKNFYIGTIHFSPNGLPTSLELDHGIGMTSMLSIVNQYNGHISCSHENSEFVLRILLSNRTKAG